MILRLCEFSSLLWFCCDFFYTCLKFSYFFKSKEEDATRSDWGLDRRHSGGNPVLCRRHDVPSPADHRQGLKRARKEKSKKFKERKKETNRNKRKRSSFTGLGAGSLSPSSSFSRRRPRRSWYLRLAADFQVYICLPFNKSNDNLSETFMKICQDFSGFQHFWDESYSVRTVQDTSAQKNCCHLSRNL